MKKHINIKIFFSLVISLFLLSGCSQIDQTAADKQANSSIENNAIAKTDEINLGDCRSDCESKSWFQRISCLAGCALSGGGNNGGTTPSTPTCTGGRVWSGSYCYCPGDSVWINDSCKSPCGKGYEGYKPNCTPLELSSVWLGSGSRYLTMSEAQGKTFSITHYPSDAPAKYSIKSSTGGFSISGSSVELSNPSGGTTSCKENSVVVNAKNDRPSSVNSNKASVCVYSCNWATGTGYWKAKGKTDYSLHWSVGECNFFSHLVSGKYYTNWHGRCCGSAPESDYGFCVGDEPYIGIANNVQWIAGPCTSGPGHYCYEGSDDWPKSDCHTYEKGTKCDTIPQVPSSVEKNASECEGNVQFDFTSKEEVCANNNTNFFSVKCVTDVNTNFDIDDNLVNSSYIIHKGQGYKINLGLTETITCTGEFDAGAWDDSYGKIRARLERVKTTKGGTSFANAWIAYQQSRASNNMKMFENYVAELRSKDTWYNANETWSIIFNDITILESLEDIIYYYNNYSPDPESIEEASLEFSYKKVGSSEKINYIANLERESNECPVVKNESDIYTFRELPSRIQKPKKFRHIYEKTVNLYPTFKTINKDNGKAIDNSQNTQSDAKTLDGGNKIYLDVDAIAQKIPIKIEITELARNKSKITNDKCEIEVTDVDLLYRPVELKNPFINDTWKIGDNWKNSMYDFRNTIHANTWSQKSLYVIDIPKEMVTTIKNSNKNNDSAYLGVCDDNNTFQDAGTEYICQFIK